MVIVQKTLTFTYSNPPGTLAQYSISSTKSVRKPSDLNHQALEHQLAG